MKVSKLILTLFAGALLLSACKKNMSEMKPATNDISDDVKAKIYQLGFGTSNIQKVEEGYLVEGDIVITPELLNSKPQRLFLRVGNEEQYRTTNLVSQLPRTVTVSLASGFASIYSNGLNDAITRYNALNLRIKFQRVSSGGNIAVTKAPIFSQYLASSGFPTSSGNPYNSIKVNTSSLFGLGGQPQTTIASVFAHEMGHCIGFRHTDYMNRAYSCGGTATNEGDGGVGAILIPGTPSGPDPNSWMLACIGSGENRPFNSNDVTALNYLYK
jgi:hypothetical protein